jgi:glyceraldehyde-3-phosphate dehydrogenase (NAD(P))
MCRKGAQLVVTDLPSAEQFNVLGNSPKALLEDALEEVDVVIDCTPAGNENKALYFLGLDAQAPGSKLFIAQGSEKGFGVPYAHGINDEILDDAKSPRFLQIVSCNTHNIACLLESIGGSSTSNIVSSDFVCIRRANDVSQSDGYVASPTVGKHDDENFGTHHARDVYDLFSTVGKYPKVQSSAMKINSQYMHVIRFAITVSEDLTCDTVISRLRKNKFVALTHKTCSNKVFSFGRDHGYYGRIYNQAVVSIPTLRVKRDLKKHETSVTGYCFTPQDGNSLLSSVAAALYGIHRDEYEQYLHSLDELLFDQI